MLDSHWFTFKSFDVDETAIVPVSGIALAAHAAGAMLVKRFEIIVNDLLCGLLPARRN